MTLNILGISAYYHDSAAALIRDGSLCAAAQEERFTRKKHDARFPAQAVDFCLREGRLGMQDIDQIVFYDKPLLKFERLLETYFCFAPRGLRSFMAAMPVWLQEKLLLKASMRKEIAALAGIPAQRVPPLLFNQHHLSHAASAFYPSPFQRALVLCLDGVGEWATATAWLGEGRELRPLWEIGFPHSLGLLYSAFTYYAGFKVNSGEYKLMGLAPYGEPRYAQRIRERLIDVKEDGSFRLDMRYFDFATGLRMTSDRFHQLFGGPPRTPDGPLGQREMDLARSVQEVVEDVVLRIARSLHRRHGEGNLCLAGGVALNCVANGRILRESGFERLWIQPAAGDAGGALGAALSAWHQHLGRARTPNPRDSMAGAYLGPAYDRREIRAALAGQGAAFEELADDLLLPRVAGLLAEGKVVGWFQGRMEFGPRALGNRSILGDPRNPDMQATMNLKIKQRESFRPFAPAVKAEAAADFFELDAPSPYMLLVAPVRERMALPAGANGQGFERLKAVRGKIPAVTHIDGSARVQTVHAETNPRFHRLLDEFERRTGCPVLVNTSFNVRGEPIVCTPLDAWKCFLRTEMDWLAMGSFLLNKAEQPRPAIAEARREAFPPD